MPHTGTELALLFALAAAVGLPCPSRGADRPGVPATGPAEKSQARVHLDAGWKLIGYINWPKALDELRAAADKATDPDDKAEALFALAYLWQYRRPDDDVDKARGYYQKIADELPKTRPAPLAVMALARLADAPSSEKDRQRDRARGLYRRILADYAHHLAADEAALRLALTYLEEVGQKASEDEGAKLLEEFLAAHPDSYLRAVMRKVLGDLAHERGQYRQAVEQWIAAAEVGVPARNEQAIIYFQIARTAEKHLKDYALAAGWYERLVEEVKGINLYYVAKMSGQRCRKLAGGRSATQPASGGGDGP